MMTALFVLAAAAAYPQTCSYSDASGNGPNEVPCTMSEAEGGANYTAVYRIQGRTFKVVNTGRRNGLWKTVLINGKPGKSYELWRDSYIFVTDDMTLSFETRGRGEPKFPAN